MTLSRFNIVSLTVGFAFLYLPIMVLILYSFNDSRLVTVWGGFSVKWYGALFSDRRFLDAALVTFYVGFFPLPLPRFWARWRRI